MSAGQQADARKAAEWKAGLPLPLSQSSWPKEGEGLDLCRGARPIATYDVLEILYFVSGIALVLIAAKGLGQIKVGLQQIKLTKEIAEKSARRDAYRLAHEQCQSFGTSVAIAVSNVLAQARALGVTIYTNPSFQVEECQIVKHDFQGNAILAALSRLDPTVPMNMLEGFAMFFVTGLADEEIGYRETAIAFCELSASLMPVFWYYRETKRAMYKSVIELYEMWHNRLALEKLQERREEVERDLSRVKPRTIKPIGVE